MDYFGTTNPKNMPEHLFFGAIYKNYETAVKADISKQNFSVCPRHWYIDVGFKCKGCEQTFIWLVEEQKAWFEEYVHYIDSKPNHCRQCRYQQRRIKKWKQIYDQHLKLARSKGDIDAKITIINTIDSMEKSGAHIPKRMLEVRDLFRKQVYKLK